MKDNMEQFECFEQEQTEEYRPIFMIGPCKVVKDEPIEQQEESRALLRRSPGRRQGGEPSTLERIEEEENEGRLIVAAKQDDGYISERQGMAAMPDHM
jgi:hypothetical protein